VPRYLLIHRHDAADCAAALEAWIGFESPLRSGRPPATCHQTSHTQTWMIEAGDPAAARAFLPPFVGDRTDVIVVG
jgi:hypothetical protein